MTPNSSQMISKFGEEGGSRVDTSKGREKIIEYTLVSVDGVFTGAAFSGFAEHRYDPSKTRDGLGQALACDALLMGRTTYEDFAAYWPRRADPWSDRINAIPKYVFSSTLEKAAWSNTTIVRGDVVAEVTRLK